MEERYCSGKEFNFLSTSIKVNRTFFILESNCFYYENEHNFHCNGSGVNQTLLWQYGKPALWLMGLSNDPWLQSILLSNAFGFFGPQLISSMSNSKMPPVSRLMLLWA